MPLQLGRGYAVPGPAAAGKGAVPDMARPAGGAARFKNGSVNPEQPRQPQRGEGAAQKLRCQIISRLVYNYGFTLEHRGPVSAPDLCRATRCRQPAELLRADRDGPVAATEPAQSRAAVMAAVITGRQPQETGAD